MSRKGKHRREARRARRGQTGAPAGAEQAGPAAHVERGAAAPAPAAAPARKAVRKRHKGGRRIRVSPWLAAIPLAAAAVAVVVVLVLQGGSSEGTGGGGTPTPDPRVVGLPIGQTVNIAALGAESGSYYQPDTIRAKAGVVVEIVMENRGTVSHNMRVSGLDKEYDTADDFAMPPNVIKPGETERLLVKMDAPGSYPFRCEFHPLDQKGTLILE